VIKRMAVEAVAPSKTVKKASKYFLLFSIVLFLIVVNTIVALDPISETGAGAEPRIICDMPNQLIEGNTYTLTCQFNYTTCLETNASGDCIDPVDEAIFNFTLTGIENSTHVKCVTNPIEYNFGGAGYSTADSLQIDFTAASTATSANCGYQVFVRTNLSGDPAPATNGNYYDIYGESYIIDQQTGLPVDVNASEVNESVVGPGVSTPDYFILLNKHIKFTVDSIASNCRYRYLGIVGSAEDVDNYNYTNSTIGCNAVPNNPGAALNNLSCGDLVIENTGTPNIFTKELLFDNDITKARYGFYCQASTGIMGHAALSFTIDTTPPQIFTSASETLVSFIDNLGDEINTTGVVYSHSRDVDLIFDTDENATCKYSVTNSDVNSHSFGNMNQWVSTTAKLSHNASVTPQIGNYRYWYFGCRDIYGNADNVSEVQGYRDGAKIMFLLHNPSCSGLNFNAIDTPDDDGGSMTISWNNSNQDGSGEDFVTRYALFRVTKAYADTVNLTQQELFEAATGAVVNVANISATDSNSYLFADSSGLIIDELAYYYYLVPYYFNDTAVNSTHSIMDNVKYNMSCVARSNSVNSSDQGYPAAITNFTAIVAMNNVKGDSLKLTWNISEDDPFAPVSQNNSMDVITYKVLRAIQGSPNELAGNYSLLATGTLNPGTSEYVDTFNLSPQITYCYIVTTTDASNLSRNSSKLCVQPNSRPYFNNMTITPDNPGGNNDLTCTIFMTDVDGDDFNQNGWVMFNWTVFHLDTFETTYIPVNGSCTPPIPPGWFQGKNLTNYTTECIANLSASHFNKGDKVWCGARGYDGDEFAKKNRTVTNINDIILRQLTYINNTAPYANSVQIYPNNATHPKGSTNLFCNYTFNDFDNDTENTSMTTFRWYINNDGFNEYVRLRGQVGQTLSSTFIDQNDLIMCSVRPYDIDFTWLNNPLQALSYVNSTFALVKDNSIPQIINYSVVPYSTATGTVSTIAKVGEDVLFTVEWMDVDVGEQASIYVCDEFASVENQASDNYNDSVHFGDDTSNSDIKTIFYTNQTGKYVSKISIKPFKFQRNDYFIYAAETLIEKGDVDHNKTASAFPDNLTFYDEDLSGTYTAGESIINDTDNNSVFDLSSDIVIRGSTPPFLAALVDLDSSNQTYYDYDGDGKYNSSEDYIYRKINSSTSNITKGDRRLEVFAEDSSEDYKNRNIDYTGPIYDMYVYEVDNPGDPIDFDNDISIAQDNNNWFVLGKYNHYHPQYNAQPLPNKHLAIVFCIDIDDDGTCDANTNYKNDSAYVHALSTQPTGETIYKVNDTSASSLKYNPEIIINYESADQTKCLRKAFCNTSLSSLTTASCTYTVQETDNETISYQVKVCDDEDACSVPRSGTFSINHIPSMKGVFIGSDSNTSAIGTDNNLMCMHLGANDENIPKADLVLDADANWTIFGDIRNRKDDGLIRNIPLNKFVNGTNETGSGTGCLAFDSLVYRDGSNHLETSYEIQTDSLIVDLGCDGAYNESVDIVIFNPTNYDPENSLRDGDTLTNVYSGMHNLSFFDANADEEWTWNSSYPEDIIYDPHNTSVTTYDNDVNYTFLWYVKPSGTSQWWPATNFTWYDNDFNDILTHGNTMPGDEWRCQVTASDIYGAASSMNSSAATIGSGGANPTLAPTILGVWDDSNSTSPTTVGHVLHVYINYSDPDSTQVKAYVCNSSRIIRNSGCFEKEFSRAVKENSSINTIETMVVNYTMEDDYNMSPTNYTVMLCDPDYYCSDVWTGESFYANHPPRHTQTSPQIFTDDNRGGSYPLNFSETRNLFCNISYKDQDDPNCNTTACYNITNATFTWYRTRNGTTVPMVSGFQGEQGAVLSHTQTLNGDIWVCSAQVADEYGGTSAYKNSTNITIGTYITADSVKPVILNVTTDSNASSPKNIGDNITFTINWYSYASPIVNIAICNSSNVNPSGCLGSTLLYTNTTGDTISIPYTIKAGDLQQFSTSTANTINYTVLIINTVGGGYANYSDQASITIDDFAVNAIPTTSTPTIADNGYLECSYVFNDLDNTSTIPYISNYSSNQFSIVWYKKQGLTWQQLTFPLTNDLVPLSEVVNNDTWICEVTPFDGYAYGIPKNSSQFQVGNTSPRIIDNRLFLGHDIPYINTSAVYVGPSSPVTLGDTIVAKVWWSDPDDTTNTVYILNDSNFASAKALGQSTSLSPTNVTFDASLLSNSTYNTNNYTLTDAFYIGVSDGGNITIYNSASITVYINRRPEIIGGVRVNNTGTTLECIASVRDNDTIADYNTTTKNYLWYVDDGSGYVAHPEYDVRVIPLAIVNSGERWICQVTPCDNYACGTPKNSTYNLSINETPQILDVDIYNIASLTATAHSANSPVRKGRDLRFTLTWADADLYRIGGENISVYVCNSSSSTKLGCNETEWCRTTATGTTSDTVSCTFDTAIVNTTIYNNSVIPYSVVIYDHADLVSNYYIGSFYIDQIPVSSNATITPDPALNTSNLHCNFSITDPDNNVTYNQSSYHLTWFVNRSGLVSDISYNGTILSHVVTRPTDKWLCQVTPTDGFYNGTSVNSSWIVIGSNVTFLNTPTIENIRVNSNSTNPTLVGDQVIFNVDWADAQQPSEYVEVYICNSTNMSDNMRCFDKEFAYLNDSSADPITLSYTVEDTLYNDASGVVQFYAKVCDDSDLCSVIWNGTFSVNHAPTVSNVTLTGATTLTCNYNFSDVDNDTNNSIIRWYRYSIDRGTCGDGQIGDGIVWNEYNEFCDVGNLNAIGCNDPKLPLGGAATGTLGCNLSSCNWDTRYCTNIPGNECGDNQARDWEDCDGSDLKGISCTDIGSFTGGNIACNNATCYYDLSQCTGGLASFCGNGIKEYGEQCDYIGDQIIASKTSCDDFPHFFGGELSCNPTTCQYDTSGCLEPGRNRYDLLGNYNDSTTLPPTEYNSSSVIVCEVTPNDNNHNGSYVISNQHRGINTTPSIEEVTVLYSTASGTFRNVNITDPVEYSNNVTINITWDDLDRFSPFGEIVDVFVCNESESTYYGCPGKELCTITGTSQTNVQCNFDTDLFNTTETNRTFYVYIYDDSALTSNFTSSVYINRLPELRSYNITPQYPIASDNLNCTPVIFDPDNQTNVTPEYASTHMEYQWFYKRGASWTAFDNGGSRIVVNFFTQVGDQWKCQISYGDGIANATPINTTPVLIRGTPYNQSKVNITEIILTSGNTYLGDPIYYDASNTVVTRQNRVLTKYDNTTNVGNYITFSIYWEDVDQLTNNSESVRVFICNDTNNFVENSGCLAKMLAFQDYTNQNPINLTYLIEDEDSTNQTFSIYLCDDSLNCSDPINNRFLVNHAPGNFTPEILSYTDILGDDVYECDYETAYEFRNASNDVNSTGGRVLNDNIASANFTWYIDYGFGYLPYTVFGATIPAPGVENVICSVNITDVYGLSSGFTNSSELDTSLIPVLWPISNVIYNGTYVISGSNITRLIGYLPSRDDANLTARVYGGFNRPVSNHTSQINTTSLLKGSTQIAISSAYNESYILVSRVTGITTKFKQNNYIEIEDQQLKYFERYKISSAPFEVQPSVYRIDIEPNLNASTSVGDTVTAYSGKYPYGWFNFSVDVFNGSSNLYVMTNTSNTLGPAVISRMFYDIATPTIGLIVTSPTKTFTPTITFNVSDDFYVNESTIFLNLSNGTHHTYHFTPSTIYDKIDLTTPININLGDDLSCTKVNKSFYDCSVQINVNPITSSNDEYYINISARDLLNTTGKNTTTFSVNTAQLPDPAAFANPIQNITILTFGLLVNLENFTEIEYAVGTAPYPDSGWNVTSSGNLNYSDQQGGSFDFSALTKFMDYNYNIYLDKTEAKIISQDLIYESNDVVFRNGSVLKRFDTNDKTNCNISNSALNSTCSIVRSSNDVWEYQTDDMLYNGSGVYALATATATLYSLRPTTYKYFDANNDSLYTEGEPVFNTSGTADKYVIDSNQTIINSSIPVLTIQLNTTGMNLAENTPYRVSVRYYNGTAKSDWTTTNPILYKPGYTSPTFNGPSTVDVYDKKNNSYYEPNNLVDIAYDTNLKWNWTASVPQNPGDGESILRYEYALGNEPWPYDGWNSVFDWRTTTSRSFDLASPDTSELVSGSTYYLTVRALSSFGLYSHNASSNGLVYDDQTPPDLSIYRVADDKGGLYYFVGEEQTDAFEVVIESDENLSQCGFSVFRTPFDINYQITRRCEIPESDNQTFVVCNLTNMDETDLLEGSHTFYVSCLDINQNGNPAIGNHSTLQVNFTYEYDEHPIVRSAWVLVNDSYGQPAVNRSYVYKNGYLTCNYSASDNDGNATIDHSATEYRWYKNGNRITAETSSWLNISRYNAKRDDYFNCSVKVRDTTLRPSNWSMSDNVTVNNSAPTVITLIEPNGIYVTTSSTLRWRYAEDIDGDDLTYNIIIMNKTDFDIDFDIVERNQSTQNENNSFDYDFTSFSDGKYYWTIETCDNSSGYDNSCTNSSDVFWFIKDTQGPFINILVPDNTSSVGKRFKVIVDVNDDNEPGVNVSDVWINFTNSTHSIRFNLTTINVNGYYEVELNKNLSQGDYNLTASANDTLGNVMSTMKQITVDLNKPILQLDFPPWKFREQYLNQSFDLDLRAYNVSTINYTITQNSTGTLVQSNHKVFGTDRDYNFTDTVNLNPLVDGKYIITFFAKDLLDNTETKTTWFAVDKTPPENGSSSFTPSPIYHGATLTVTMEWFNNSLVPDDNQYGIKNVTFYFVNSTNITAPIFNIASATASYVDENTYIIGSPPTLINGTGDYKNYSYAINNNYVIKNTYIHWLSCAWDHAGNRKCTQNYRALIDNRRPNVTGLITDIVMNEDDGNNTIILNGSLADPDNEALAYSVVVLPTGTLLYDPLDSADRTTALQGNNSGLNTIFQNVVLGNATLVERNHTNLLTNPGFEYSEPFNDSNGTVRKTKPVNWTLKNDAGYNDTGLANFTIYSGDIGGVNVSAKHYYFQEVTGIQEGEEYSLSMWMKPSNNLTTRGRLHVNWYEDDGSFIDSTLNLSSSLTRPLLDSDWKRYTASFTAPTDADKARVYIDTDANETWAYVDNVAFEKGDRPTYYSRQNHATGYIKYPVTPTYGNTTSTRPYINASQGTLEVSIMPLWNGNDTYSRYLFDVSGSDDFYAITDGLGNLTFKYDSKSISYNISAWTSNIVYNLGFTWSNDTNITMYVNGLLVNYTNTSISTPSIGTDIYLGSDSSTDNQIDAVLDEFVIFEHKKNSTDIAKDNRTVPVSNNTNTNNTLYTLVFINGTTVYQAATGTVALLNVTNANKDKQPDIEYDQRVQFFGDDGSKLIASNVVNVHVKTNDNLFMNVTIWNGSTNVTYYPNATTPRRVSEEANNITYSNINHSTIYNLSVPFGIRRLDASYSTLQDSIVRESEIRNSTVNNSVMSNSVIKISNVDNSNILDSEVYNGTILDSNVTNGSLVNNSQVKGGSSMFNSNVTDNSELRINVTLINSTVTNNTILGDAYIVNAFIDPSVMFRVRGQDFTVVNSSVYDSYLENSVIYNLTNATNNSRIVNCTLYTFRHRNFSNSSHKIHTKLEINNASLQGDSSQENCRLLNGTITVYDVASESFIYKVASDALNAQPLIEDIWNYTPVISILDGSGNSLNSTKNLVGPNMTLYLEVIDPNIGSTILDYVNVSWTYYYGANPQYKNLTEVNQSNLTSQNISAFITAINVTQANTNILVEVTDRFGNTVNATVLGLNYTYSNSSPACGNSIVDPGEGCDDGDLNSGDGCSATCTEETGWNCSGTPSTCTTTCGDGIRAGTEECDDGDASNNDACLNTCVNATCGDNYLWSGTETCDGNKLGGATCSDFGNFNRGTLDCYANCSGVNTSACYRSTSSGGGGGGSGGTPYYCTNNMKDTNYGEIGIDCGGRCPSCESLCSNKVRDGAETGVDCGGVCPDSCKTALTPYVSYSYCYNGKKDGNEDGVDCGGVCLKECKDDSQPTQTVATCNDGKKNQGEEGVDCGGPCKSCSQSGISEKDYSWVLWFIIIFVILVIFVIIGVILIDREHKKQKQLEDKEQQLEQKLAVDEQTIASLRSGNTIADATTAGLYAKQEVKSHGPISDSVINLEKYIIASLDSGMKPSKIKEIVVDSGWDPSVTEVVLHKIMLSGTKLEEVERFISKQIQKGASDAAIANKLMRAHWSKEIVDLIISDVHNITKNSDKLHDYISKKVKEGKSLDEIHQILVSIGWNEHYIERMLDKHGG